MHRRKLLGLAVSLLTLAATAAPAGAAPVHPDPAPSAGFFKSATGLGMESGFMDYTDDVMLTSH
jgi:hypothetical protein